MSYAKRAIQGTAVVFVMSILASIFGYLFRLVLARNLAPAEYGLFYAVFAFVTFFSIFTDFGLSYSVVKFIPEFTVKKKPELIKSSLVFIFWFQAIACSVISLALFLAAPFLAASYFHEPAASLVMRLFLIAFWLSSLKVFVASIQGFQKLFAYSSMNLLRMATVIVVALFFSMNGFSVLVPVYAYIAAELLVVLLSLVLLVKEFPIFFKLKTHITKPFVSSLFAFGIPITLSSVSYLIISYMDTIILTYFQPLEQVALYNVAMPIALVLMWFIAHPLSTVLVPMISELWSKKNMTSLKSGLETIQRYVVVGIVPLALMLIAFPEIIVRVLFGEPYVGAAPVLRILSVGMVFYSLAYVNTNVLSGMGKPKEATKIIGIIALINVVLNIVLIPLMGIIGAAIAVTTGYIIMMFMTIRTLRRYIDLNTDLVVIFKTLCIGIALVALVTYLKALVNLPYLLESVILGFVTLVLYVVLVFALRLINMQQMLSFIRDALHRK